MFPRRLSLLLFVAALAALLVPAGASAKAATSSTYPTIRTVAPKKLAVGDRLTIAGKGYRKGKNRTTVVFKRDGARAIFVKVPNASATKVVVAVPAKLLPYFKQQGGQPVATRFRLRILAKRFGKGFTTNALSPMISPSGPTATASAADCDGDGIANAKETDDDDDLISDATETAIGTDPCKADTDGDGMTDGWEYYSALDRNSKALPSPTAKPYPNPLFKGDADTDQDGDALTNLEEYSAWASFGGHRLPLSYSGGNPASAGRVAVSADQAYMDRDDNGYLSDNERDADGDGISNQDEGTLTRPVKESVVGFFDPAYLKIGPVAQTINTVPLYGALPYTEKADSLEWLSPDTDGDGVNDGADDQDHDDVPNLQELKDELAAPADKKTQRPLNACSPNLDSRGCIVARLDADHDGIPNGVDPDDDNDNLPDTLEISLGLRPDKDDTDGDGVSDGFEYNSAKDLNNAAVPFPGKRPYPNPLDPSDANLDFDQDGLTLSDEYRAWRYLGSQQPYNYSDGTRWSIGNPGELRYADDERDADGDGLSNWVESGRGPMSQSWWVEIYNGTTGPKESKYPGPEYLDTSMVDYDTDGDGIGDGADDQDHDDYPNWFEVQDGAGFVAPGRLVNYMSTWKTTSVLARRQPFNPCKPVQSLNCHAHPPIGYYPADEDWSTPVRPGDPGTDVPANIPPTLIR